jgi:hypothetical protein
MGSFGIDWFWSSADAPVPGNNVTYRSTPLKDNLDLVLELITTVGKYYSEQAMFDLLNDERTQDGWHTAVTQALLDLNFHPFAIAFCDEYNNVEAADSSFVGDVFVDRHHFNPQVIGNHPRRFHQLRFVVWQGENNVDVIHNAVGELPVPGHEYPAVKSVEVVSE